MLDILNDILKLQRKLDKLKTKSEEFERMENYPTGNSGNPYITKIVLVESEIKLLNKILKK